MEELIKFIYQIKTDAQLDYLQADNEEAKAVYACQNMVCGMILKKIEILNAKGEPTAGKQIKNKNS